MPAVLYRHLNSLIHRRCLIISMLLTIPSLLFFLFCLQLFYSFFKSLVGKDVVVELKNDLRFVYPKHFSLCCF